MSVIFVCDCMGILGELFRKKDIKKEDVGENLPLEDISQGTCGVVENSLQNHGEIIGINNNSSCVSNTSEKIEEYISRYLSNAPEFFLNNIIYLSELQSDDEMKRTYEMKDWYSLDHVKDDILSLIKESNDKLKVTSDPEDKEVTRGVISIWESFIKFIEDSKKFKRIFDKNGYNVTFLQYYTIFLDCVKKKQSKIQNEKDNQMESLFGDYYNPYLIIWKNKYGPAPTKCQILKEVYCTSFPDLDEGSNLSLSMYQFILRKCGFDCSADEIESLLSDIRDEVEIESFEANLEDEFNFDNTSLQTQPKFDISNLDGYQFERLLCDVFEQLGYTAVLTSKSRDQGADLVISKDGTKTVVQAKYYEGKVSNGAIQEVVAAKAYYGANEALVITTGSFTKSALDLAEVNDVILWDGEKLSEVLSSLNQVIDSDMDTESSSEYCCPFCDVMFLVDTESLLDNNVIVECPRCDNDIFFENGVIVSEDEIREGMSSCVDAFLDHIKEVCDLSVAKIDVIVGLILDAAESCDNISNNNLYVIVYRALNEVGMTYDFSVVKELVDSVKCNNNVSLKNLSERSHQSLKVSVDGEVNEIGFKINCPVCGESVEISIERNEKPQTVDITCPHCGVMLSAQVTQSKNPSDEAEEE